MLLRLLLALAASTAILAAGPSLPFLSPIFGDNMVLQRDKPDSIWGWSVPGREIRVELGGKVVKTIVAKDGRWQASIQPPPPGGPYTLTIDGPEHRQLREILVGDVWICGGQSNMQLPLSRTRDGEQTIQAAHNPEIRLFTVAAHPSYSPAFVPNGQWLICSPETVATNGGFSAVGYYFGRRAQQDVHVPIGLIEDCLGGTPAEAWTSAGTLRRLGGFDSQLDEMDRLKAKGGPQYGNYIMHWYDDYDIGIKSNWAGAQFDDSTWKTVQIPGGFGELGVGDAPSVCWFRKDIVLPDPLPPGPAGIYLGIVERMDTTYVNGHWVGASAWVENPRAYPVNRDFLHPGRNTIAIRVFKTKPNGGFMSKAHELRLAFGDKTAIPLAGDWKSALSVDARPPHPLPVGFENWPVMPSVLYMGMLAPVAPLSISGAIWYQGEANADRAYQYRTLLPAMIQDWRAVFHQRDFPFYIVSLPAFMHHRDEPTESAWAELREAQTLTAEHVPHCALAVTIDTGDPDNIHPPDKEIVGDRLAFCALAEHYHEKIPYQGPTYASLDQLPHALKIHFTHTDGGLAAKDGHPAEFSIAGKDHVWRWADARIDGTSIIVFSPDVAHPVAARYAWQSFPVATLYNGAGLPAVPFRTDNWPETTQK